MYVMHTIWKGVFYRFVNRTKNVHHVSHVYNRAHVLYVTCISMREGTYMYPIGYTKTFLL